MHIHHQLDRLLNLVKGYHKMIMTEKIYLAHFFHFVFIIFIIIMIIIDNHNNKPLIYQG